MAPRRRKPITDPKRVIGYIRVSTDEQGLGPVAQRKALESWCLARRAALSGLFDDIWVSGVTPLEKRSGLNQALSTLSDENAGILLVAKRGPTGPRRGRRNGRGLGDGGAPLRVGRGERGAPLVNRRRAGHRERGGDRPRRELVRLRFRRVDRTSGNPRVRNRSVAPDLRAPRGHRSLHLGAYRRGELDPPVRSRRRPEGAAPDCHGPSLGRDLVVAGSSAGRRTRATRAAHVSVVRAEAEALAVILNSGVLPARVPLLERR